MRATPRDRRQTLTLPPSLTIHSPPSRSRSQPATATTATPSALPALLASSRAPSRAPRAAAPAPATAIAASPRTARAVAATTALTAPVAGESPPDPRPNFRFRCRGDPEGVWGDPSRSRIPPRALACAPARRFPRPTRDEKKQRTVKAKSCSASCWILCSTRARLTARSDHELTHRSVHLFDFTATRAPTAAAPARAAGASPATSSTPPRRATKPKPNPSPRSPTTRSPSRTSRLPRLPRRLPSTPPCPRAPRPRRLTPPPSPP